MLKAGAKYLNSQKGGRKIGASAVTAPVTWATVTASKSTVSLVTATGNLACNHPANAQFCGYHAGYLALGYHPAIPDYMDTAWILLATLLATACPLLATHSASSSNKKPGAVAGVGGGSYASAAGQSGAGTALIRPLVSSSYTASVPLTLTK